MSEDETPSHRSLPLIQNLSPILTDNTNTNSLKTPLHEEDRRSAAKDTHIDEAHTNSPKNPSPEEDELSAAKNNTLDDTNTNTPKSPFRQQDHLSMATSASYESQKQSSYESESEKPSDRSWSTPSHRFYRGGTFAERMAGSLGLFPPVVPYVLPPRPKKLETPVAFGTPLANSTRNNLFKTPILPPKFIEREEGQVVESLAEQLRALLLICDTARDDRLVRAAKLKYIYGEKLKDFERKEQERKEKYEADERKLIAAKARMKLEADKMKETEMAHKKLGEEMSQLKTKFVENSRILADSRRSNTQLQQKLKKAQEDLQKEKEKSLKLDKLNGKLSNEISLERRMRGLMKGLTPTPPPQHEAPPPLARQPLRPVQLPATTPAAQMVHEFQPPESYLSQPQQQSTSFQPQPPPAQRRLTNTSSSSVSSAVGPVSNNKNVRWGSPIAETRESSSLNSSENHFSSLQFYITDDLQQLGETIDNPDFVEKQYRRFGRYRVMKKCGCESIRYDNGDIQYCCLRDVNVNLCYFEENGQITLSLPGEFTVNSFASKQLEIHRGKTKEKSIVRADGKRYEYLNVAEYQNPALETFFKDEWKRTNPNGTTEWLTSDSKKTTIRAENDFVIQEDNYIQFNCPGFTVTRGIDESSHGAVSVKVSPTAADSNKRWKISICPECRVFAISHDDGKDKIYCTETERRCQHKN